LAAAGLVLQAQAHQVLAVQTAFLVQLRQQVVVAAAVSAVSTVVLAAAVEAVATPAVPVFQAKATTGAQEATELEQTRRVAAAVPVL
jgi:hypothetical protein